MFSDCWGFRGPKVWEVVWFYYTTIHQISETKSEVSAKLMCNRSQGISQTLCTPHTQLALFDFTLGFFLPHVLRVPSFVANRHILPSCWTFQRVGCLWIIKKTSLVSYCLITSTQEETFKEHITFNTQLLLIWCTYASLFCQVSL